DTMQWLSQWLAKHRTATPSSTLTESSDLSFASIPRAWDQTGDLPAQAQLAGGWLQLFISSPSPSLDEGDCLQKRSAPREAGRRSARSQRPSAAESPGRPAAQAVSVTQAAPPVAAGPVAQMARKKAEQASESNADPASARPDR
ncbi:unnamed protein product, partial [Polarella glacialis]